MTRSERGGDGWSGTTRSVAPASFFKMMAASAIGSMVGVTALFWLAAYSGFLASLVHAIDLIRFGGVGR